MEPASSASASASASAAAPERSGVARECWPPLPGTTAFLQQQAELDSITFHTVSACLRQTAAQITPLLHTLYFRNSSLAALECCATLEALAQEVEQDDVQTVHERAREAARPYYSYPV